MAVARAAIVDNCRTAGDLTVALSEYRAALSVAERLAADSTNAQLQHDLSVLRSKLGGVCLLRGDLSEALREYDMALAIA